MVLYSGSRIMRGVVEPRHKLENRKRVLRGFCQEAGQWARDIRASDRKGEFWRSRDYIDCFVKVSQHRGVKIRLTPAVAGMWANNRIHLIESYVRAARDHVPPGHSRDRPSPPFKIFAL
jgi:hypothetical protein